MDLIQEWQNMSAAITTTEQNRQLSEFTLNKASKSLLHDLIFKIKWKFRWIRIIDLPILAIALFSDRDLKIVLIGIFVLYELFRWLGQREINKISSSLDYTLNSRQVLQNHLAATNKVLRIEKIWGLITAPIAAPIGFLCYKLAVLKTFESVLAQPNFFWQIAAVAPIGILFYFLANKMNRHLFKEQTERLKRSIEALSQ